MKHIYYVRHGQTKANAADITAGSELETPLTKMGQSQARQAGQLLKDKRIELIVCSPMGRARETAAIIASEIGYDAKLIVDQPLFTERQVGIYSGRPHSEYTAANQGSKLDKSVETTAQMHQRVSQGMEWLRRQTADTILIVSHGGTGRIIRSISENLHHSEAYSHDGFGNAEIYDFDLN